MPGESCRLVSADQREEKNDSKMVGALVHRLLNSFESNTGRARLCMYLGILHTLGDLALPSAR